MKIPRIEQLIFLPGASGRIEFWQPLADALEYSGEEIFFGYPGFGGVPDAPGIKGLSDVVERVVSLIDKPTALIAQSMGGVVAVQAANARPDLVSHLVLAVTSGGLDMSAFSARDWRADFAGQYYSPDWFTRFSSDLSEEISRLRARTLLLWGDQDPYSPVAVGRKLASLIPVSELHILPGGDHDLGCCKADEISALVDLHLMS
ncbi:alpha/beta hydrolase [Pseudomonas sp. USTB-Z]|jgi:pimeloyl-ACP methyl ester carboxylesterase|uniref:alpha/beta fold hydrolase n=1 Tax=Pseudomonas sp. USTB-Z TaxID=2794351 RepID=UPI001C82EC18|nr:alpha/beta hydrolase [Pseudomonas sp. USTB-Z]MBX6689786.1 alpha/beta hydrolase [Pseudomonas sp. USTB-Z]